MACCVSEDIACGSSSKKQRLLPGFDSWNLNKEDARLYSYNIESDSEDEGQTFTEEDQDRYRKQVLESDGFDVDVRTNVCVGNFIYYLGELSEEQLGSINPCARKALTEYNAKNGTDWEFDRVIKTNEQFVGGLRYYITFHVVSTSQQASQDFQARVFHRPWEDRIDVQLVRPRKVSTAFHYAY